MSHNLKKPNQDKFASHNLKRVYVPVHTHRRCVDCGIFVTSVRCDRDHSYDDDGDGLLCDGCYEKELIE